MNDIINRLRDEAAALRDQREGELHERGVGPVGEIAQPSSVPELRNDYWYYAGRADAFEDLLIELAVENERAA